VQDQVVLVLANDDETPATHAIGNHVSSPLAAGQLLLELVVDSVSE